MVLRNPVQNFYTAKVLQASKRLIYSSGSVQWSYFLETIFHWFVIVSVAIILTLVVDKLH